MQRLGDLVEPERWRPAEIVASAAGEVAYVLDQGGEVDNDELPKPTELVPPFVEPLDLGDPANVRLLFTVTTRASELADGRTVSVALPTASVFQQVAKGRSESSALLHRVSVVLTAASGLPDGRVLLGRVSHHPTLGVGAGGVPKPGADLHSIGLCGNVTHAPLSRAVGSFIVAEGQCRDECLLGDLEHAMGEAGLGAAMMYAAFGPSPIQKAVQRWSSGKTSAQTARIPLPNETTPLRAEHAIAALVCSNVLTSRIEVAGGVSASAVSFEEADAEGKDDFVIVPKRVLRDVGARLAAEMAWDPFVISSQGRVTVSLAGAFGSDELAADQTVRVTVALRLEATPFTAHDL